MFHRLKYFFFKKRRNKFISEMYLNEDPWSGALNLRAIAGFIDTHTQGKYQNTLDVGCGEGLLTPALVEISRSYLGIDISTQALSRAKEKNRNLSQASFKHLDFDDVRKLQQKFDLLCFSFSLDYLGFQKYPKQFTKNLYELISSSAAKHCDLFIFNPVYNEKNLEDIDKYLFILKNFGFHLKHQEFLAGDGFKTACVMLVKRE